MRIRLFAVAAAVLGTATFIVAANAPASAATIGPVTPVTASFQLSGIGCAPGTTSCVAVGEPAVGGSNQAVLVPISNGNVGTAFAPANQPSALGLNKVRCATATTCLAVGLLDQSPAIVPVTVGGEGTPSSKPVAAFLGQFYDVACATPTTCVAVGGTFQPFQGIIAPINNGVLGSVVTVPQVHDLGGIACQGTNACTAVGQDGSGNAIVLPITDAANLTLGSITTITQASGLSDISCPLSTWCVAVGGANVTGPPNDLEGAVVTLPLGGVDAVQLVPGTSGLSSVDCVSASSCVTVGAVFVTCCQANGVVVPIDDGVAGTETTLPSTSTLEGVACWNATSCMASGAQPSDQPGGGNAVLVPITLTPPAPAFSANPTSVTFAPRHIGTTSAPVTVTVTNTGGAPLTFGSVVIGGANPAAFKITTNTCTGSLAPGAQCSTSVTFKPGADKTLNAVLKYTDNAATSPQSIPLSGRGCFNQGGASCM